MTAAMDRDAFSAIKEEVCPVCRMAVKRVYVLTPEGVEWGALIDADSDPHGAHEVVAWNRRAAWIGRYAEPGSPDHDPYSVRVSLHLCGGGG